MVLLSLVACQPENNLAGDKDDPRFDSGDPPVGDSVPRFDSAMERDDTGDATGTVTDSGTEPVS